MFFLLLVAVSGGCTQFDHKEEKTIFLDGEKSKTQKNKESEQEDTKSSVDKGTEHANVPPEIMYKVMLAEMLAKRNQGKLAFEVLYPVALETRDKKLAERTFEFSMMTLDVNSIGAATQLWMEVSPEEAMPWKAAYLIDLRAGQVGEALDKWQKYRVLSEDSIETILVETGSRVPQAADAKVGLTFLKRIKENYAEQPAAYFAFGSAAEKYQQYLLAIAPLQESIKLYQSLDENLLSPISLKVKREAHLLLANSFLKSKQYQIGLDYLADYIEKNPKDWELHEKLARLEVKAGLYAEAENRYQLIVDNEPNAHTSELSLGLLKMERRDFIGAEKHFKNLKEIPLYHSTASYYLALSSQEQGDSDKAIKLFNQISSDDYYIDAQLHIAEIIFVREGLEKSLAIVQMLEPKSNKDRVKLYRAKALLYKEAGQYEKSVASYQDALSIVPNNVEILVLQAYVYYEMEDFANFEKNLVKVLKLDENNVDALNGLGYFYAETKQKLDEASILLEKANRLSPNSFYIIDSLGWLAYQQGDLTKAETLLEKAFSIRADLEVLLHLIEVKVSLEKEDEAIDLIEKNKKHFPDSKRLTTLLGELKK